MHCSTIQSSIQLSFKIN